MNKPSILHIRRLLDEKHDNDSINILIADVIICYIKENTNIEIIEYAINKLPSKNKIQIFKFAVVNNKLEIINLFKNCKYDFDYHWVKYFKEACTKNYIIVVEILLRNKLNVKLDKYIKIASSKGYTEMVKILLDNSTKDIYKYSNDFFHVAVIYNHSNMVKFLLSNDQIIIHHLHYKNLFESTIKSYNIEIAKLLFCDKRCEKLELFGLCNEKIQIILLNDTSFLNDSVSNSCNEKIKLFEISKIEPKKILLQHPTFLYNLDISSIIHVDKEHIKLLESRICIESTKKCENLNFLRSFSDETFMLVIGYLMKERNITNISIDI